MATEVEQQLQRYFGWLEARTGTPLHRESEGSGDAASESLRAEEIREIVELELHLQVPSAQPRRRVYRALAATAVVAVVFSVVGLVSLYRSRNERTAEISSAVVIEPSAQIQLRGPLLPAAPDSARFTVDGRDIIVIAGGTIASIDAGTAAAGPQLPFVTNTATVRVNPAGTRALVQGAIVDTNTGKRLVELAGARADLRGDFDPSGERVVVPTDAPQGRGRATVFDTASGQALFRLETDETAITWAIYSPDGSKIMTQGTSGQTRVWDAVTGHPILTLDDSDSGSTFSPDGSAVLSMGPSGRVRMRDAVTGASLAVDRPLVHVDDAVAWFSTDGSTIAVSETDPVDRQPTISLFAASTGERTGQFVGAARGQTFTTANFSPGGGSMVVGLPDGSAAIWSTATSSRVAVLGGTGSTFVALAFSPDGTSITGLQADGTLLIWEAP